MRAGYDNWFFNTLGGIRPDPEAPGFLRVLLEPRPCPSLDSCQVDHTSNRGKISSHWRNHGQTFVWDIRIPPGSTAVARMPYSGERKRLGEGRHRLEEDVSE
jgi:alpha-L-rhamnosidase